MKTESDDIAFSAAADCAGSSSTINRTRTLVSTARKATPHLRSDGGIHLLDGVRRSLVFDDAPKVSDGKLLLLDWLEQDAFRPILDDKFRTRFPAPLVADGLGQDDLTSG